MSESFPVDVLLRTKFIDRHVREIHVEYRSIDLKDASEFPIVRSTVVHPPTYQPVPAFPTDWNIMARTKFNNTREHSKYCCYRTPKCGYLRYRSKIICHNKIKADLVSTPAVISVEWHRTSLTVISFSAVRRHLWVPANPAAQKNCHRTCVRSPSVYLGNRCESRRGTRNPSKFYTTCET